MRVFAGLDDFVAATGESIGTSDWLVVDQQRIDEFARATGDEQWIHCDPQRAAAGPFGTTIAHGFLTLALLSTLWDSLYRIDGVRMGVNYGLGKVRFPSPVPVNSRIRVTSVLVEAIELGGSAVQATVNNTIEIEGQEKPACVAESIARYFR